MSDLLWTPGKPQRQNVQLSGKERVCVLVHRKTKRILCFARDDWFADSFAKDYEKIEILHAHQYDRWAKRYREQGLEDGEREDYEKLCREDTVRQVLRKQLRDRLNAVQTGAERMAIESALRCLDVLQAKKERYRESFMVQEAFEQSKSDVGQEIAQKIIGNG